MNTRIVHPSSRNQGSLLIIFLDMIIFISLYVTQSNNEVQPSKHQNINVVEEEDYTEMTKSKGVTKEDGIMFTTIGEKLYHNDSHFTQGLTYSKSSDMLFESNGLYGRSNLCRLDPETGFALFCRDIEKSLFAEGMQVYGDGNDEKLVQLTWKSQRGFIYNATTLDRISEFHFETRLNEGWGICFDDTKNEFIVSDGSNTLHFWDVDTLKEKRRVRVTRQNGEPAKRINELELVNGRVLANVWYEDVILIIDPESGECESEYGKLPYFSFYVHRDPTCHH